MQVPYIRANIDLAAYNLSNKIKDAIGQKRDGYIITRLCAANDRLGDQFSAFKAEKILNKVGNQATKDWGNAHKVQNFLLKNAYKVSKGAIIGGIALGTTALAAGVVKLVNSVKANKKK